MSRVLLSWLLLLNSTLNEVRRVKVSDKRVARIILWFIEVWDAERVHGVWALLTVWGLGGVFVGLGGLVILGVWGLLGRDASTHHRVVVQVERLEPRLLVRVRGKTFLGSKVLLEMV